MNNHKQIFNGKEFQCSCGPQWEQGEADPHAHRPEPDKQTPRYSSGQETLNRLNKMLEQAKEEEV